MNPITTNRRHFEDLVVGEKLELGTVTVSKEMIVAWAREFDPLPFHLSEEAGRRSLLGGLASSGWQTGALALRGLCDGFLNSIASAGGLGFSDLKWKKPVMAGDSISIAGTIGSLRRSQSQPDRGIVTVDLVVTNQKGQRVMTMTLANMVEARTAGPDAVATPAQPYDATDGLGTAS